MISARHTRLPKPRLPKSYDGPVSTSTRMPSAMWTRLGGTALTCVVAWIAVVVSAIPAWPADQPAKDRTAELAAALVCGAVVVAGIYAARKRRTPFYVRPPAALAAVDDALGRATELGAPVVYLTGWGGDLARPTTMASMAILSDIAERSAAYGTRVLFPSHDPVIVSAAHETLQQAYLRAGRPEMFRAADAWFVTQSQMGYAAGVEGIISREKPGAVFLLGSFEGEALILAEHAHAVGAVQISGTDSTIQLSFFLVACDYTLIGEELFAASACMSGDPVMLGAVRGQDVLKIIIVAFLLAGFVMGVLGGADIASWLG